jgi:hypothetical protein
MTDLLNDTRAEIAARLAELEPLLEEYQELQAAAAALKAIPAGPRQGVSSASLRRGTSGTPRVRAATRPASPEASTSPATARPARKTRAKTRGGRPKGTGKRAVQALALIGEQPGITIPELAERMGVVRTYLYRVLPPLQKEAKITKSGGGWKVKEVASR